MSWKIWAPAWTMAAAACLVAQPRPYSDPQGRFTVQMPAGWTLKQLNSDAVYLSAGAAYCTLMVLPGDDPRPSLDAIAKQTGGQWKNFKEARRGEMRLAGRAGTYITYSGTNPVGAEAYLEMMAVSDRGRVFLLMMSAPKAEFGNLKPAFDLIEQSLTVLAGQTTPAPTAPPPAAQTPRPSPGVPPPAPSTGAPAGVAGAGQPAAVRLKRAAVIDQQSFERPMPAMSMLIPTDWQLQPNITYLKTFGGCHENTIQVGFRAASADQRVGIEMFPDYVWTWMDDPGMRQAAQASSRQFAAMGGKPCDVIPAMRAADYLQRVIIPRD